jgi:transcriptional regulator with XRE-family HTH domain
MFLHSNIKFLRNYTRTTQAEFGKLFGCTRSNIDSYERGNAKPPEGIQLKIAQHFNISLEVLITKDLQMNPV